MTTKYNLPVEYDNLSSKEKKVVREQYISLQKGLCWHCEHSLDNDAPAHILAKPINHMMFPPRFLKYPIHLQHDHDTGLTEGVVHAYCNAVLWQYYGR